MNVFRKIQTSDRILNSIQESVSQALNPVLKVPLNDGVLIKNISLTTAGLKVPHQLGRQPLGWILVDKNANADVWRVSWSDTTIELDTTASCTVSIWVF